MLLIAKVAMVAYACHNLLYLPGVKTSQVLVWGFWTAIAMGVASLFIHLLIVLDRRHAFKRANLGSWTLFLLILTAGPLAAGVLRSSLAPLGGGFPLPEGQFWPFAMNLFFSLLTIYLAIEWISARACAYRERSADAQAAIDELATAQRTLIEADDALRQETAEFLHGEMQTRLLVAWVQLDQAIDLWERDAPAADALLVKADEHLSHLQTQSMLQAKELFGLPPSEQSFLSEIGALIDRMETLIPIALDVRPEVRGLDHNPSPAIRRAALGLFEEVLLNACRHAQATAIRVEIALQDSSSLLLSVHDDGIGFAPAGYSLGLGLSGLSKALEDEGGTWRLHSQKPGGTQALIQLPLRQPVGEQWP